MLAQLWRERESNYKVGRGSLWKTWGHRQSLEGVFPKSFIPLPLLSYYLSFLFFFSSPSPSVTPFSSPISGGSLISCLKKHWLDDWPCLCLRAVSSEQWMFLPVLSSRSFFLLAFQPTSIPWPLQPPKARQMDRGHHHSNTCKAASQRRLIIDQERDFPSDK